jgi:RNA polymerase sigma-70 factor (ECF subfamily)
MKGNEDETAVDRARAGDLTAFQSLVEQHSRDVFRLAFRITRNEMDAEDAVQETFLRAYQKLSSFDGRASFSTWLYRVTANSSIDVLRRRRRDESRSSSLDDDTAYSPDPVSHSPAPDRLLFDSEVKERLRGALDELSDLERTAFVMRHFENFSLDEIGRALGLRVSATKQAVFRAVKKVRRTLEPVVRTTS